MQSQLFQDFALSGPILAAIRQEGYEKPTDIQAHAIPLLLEGNDLLGTAQTGTGKTAAFVLPLLDRLMKERVSRSGNPTRREPARPRALILAPTRELAIQIDESIRRYGAGSGISRSVVFGGAPKPSQAARLRNRPQILTATPGRLMDFVGEGLIDLSAVEILILDEADRMLDMGFIPTVRTIAEMAKHRNQTVLFSATMPKEIERLAAELLNNPERVAIAPQDVTVDRIQQSVLHMTKEDKNTMLPQLIRDRGMFRVIVFTRTKHRASRIARMLHKEQIPADAIHGDRSQNQRQRALEQFRRGRIQVLVATDVAARGIDVDDVTHVINYEIPNEAESYVHRIGRTGRAGSEGIAIALCDREELKDFRAIEALIGQQITIDRDHPYHQEPAPPRRTPQGGGSRNSRRNNRQDSSYRRSAHGERSDRPNRSGRPGHPGRAAASRPGRGPARRPS